VYVYIRKHIHILLYTNHAPPLHTHTHTAVIAVLPEQLLKRLRSEPVERATRVRRAQGDGVE
jgi:hypothetical protein